MVLRHHLEKFSCFVETGIELRSFEQSDEGVTAVLVKNEISETVHTKWVIGADGAKGVRYGVTTTADRDWKLIGAVRKQLGLTFMGETRDDIHILVTDIRLKGAGLDRQVCLFTIQ